MVGRLQRGRKVIHKGDVEVFQLFGEPLRTRISGGGGKRTSRAGRRARGSKYTKS
jgi:hypothetical protein